MKQLDAYTQVFDVLKLKKPNNYFRKQRLLFFVIGLSVLIMTSNFAHSQGLAKTELDVDAVGVLTQPGLLSDKQESTSALEESDRLKSASSEGIKGAESIQDSVISITPIVDVDPELKLSLDRQFDQIQTLLETEDAFSEKLGENYFSYGKLLLQVARIDDAKEAFINAMHIAKVNNGVDSIEQRPMLRELFEISYALQDLKEVDFLSKRITRLEERRTENIDTYSFDILMRIGHLYMNTYLANPNRGDEGARLLDRAMSSFKYATSRYGDKPLSELLMPYGELAFLWYLKKEIKQDLSKDLKSVGRTQVFSDFNNRSFVVTPERARSEGLKHMKAYYEKANTDGDEDSAVRALLNTGDLNLLYGYNKQARQFYELAWKRAQALPQENSLVKSFDNVVKLPNFKYGLVLPKGQFNTEYDEVPLKLTIDVNGYVRKIDTNVDRKLFGAQFNRAKRLVKRYRFRPILENGKLLPLSVSNYVVKVPIRKKR